MHTRIGGFVTAAVVAVLTLTGCTQMPPPFEAKVVNISIVSKGREVIIDAIRTDNSQTAILGCSIYVSPVCAVLVKGDTIRVVTDYHDGAVVERIARGEG